MRALRSSLLIGSLLFVGCAASVDGQIDDESVSPLISAFFGTATANKAHVVDVVALSWPTSCEKLGSWLHDRDKNAQRLAESDHESSDRDRFAEDQADTDKELGLPDNAWQLSMFVIDRNAVEDDDDFKVLDEMSLSLQHQTEAPDYDEWARKGQDPSVDTYVAIDGDVTFDSVKDDAMKISTDDLDFGDNDDVIKHGDNADVVGTAKVSVNATFCQDLSDYLDDIFQPLDDGPLPSEGEGAGDPPGQTCTITDDCPNIACICDDGSALGSPVNTHNCVNNACQQATQACPTSCEQFGMTWTGNVFDPGTSGEGEGEGEGATPPPPPQTGTCDGFIGVGDGCDCGCGVFDTDCASTTATCSFNDCASGTPDPSNNAFCI